MIQPRPTFQAGEVAAHYNDLDRFYREIWGEHVHHGLWRSRQETTEEATYGLIAEVAAQARLRAGDRVCDVGCGYSGTSRSLRALARVTGRLSRQLSRHASEWTRAVSRRVCCVIG
jgi:tocopherol O-methyltransferase